MALFWLYFILSPLIWIVIRFFALFHRKTRARIFHERELMATCKKKVAKAKSNKTIIAFHAASAGEFEQLRPILPKVDRSRYFILQTFFSSTILCKEVSSDLFDAVCYHPVDTPLAAIKFFVTIKPAYYIVTRHDLWPIHLFFARLFSIKTVLINANMHQKTHRKKRPFKSINKIIFSYFDIVLCGSQRLKQNLSSFTSKKEIIVTGDTRFEQVVLRKKKNLKNHFDTPVKRSKTVVLGSIIPSDYKPIFKGMKDYIDDKVCNKIDFSVIAVPHEIDENSIVQLEKAISYTGLSVARYSKEKSFAKYDCLIIDAVGILAELYCYASLAYLGAGFGAGVHNVLEPAVYGCAISYGPNYHILDEAVSMAEDDISSIINTKDDFKLFLKLFDNREKMMGMGEKATLFSANHQNASQNIIDSIFA